MKQKGETGFGQGNGFFAVWRTLQTKSAQVRGAWAWISRVLCRPVCHGAGGLVRRTRIVWFFWLIFALFEASGAPDYVACEIMPPKLPREMRAVWVATVANIDWPSTNGLSVAQQQAELVALLDRAVQLKLNTVIFQVRPACDALYSSPYEPWSEYLTGVMGKAPEPFYDPLAFAVEQAHRRGLELHAWFNPFRARHIVTRSGFSSNHISKTRPDWVKRYGQYLWLDPGEPAVRDYSLKVILDVLKRYDVDGVHLDDYFYPYKERTAAGAEMDFPDEPSWTRSGCRGRMDREDWRRQNVNQFIQRLYREVKTAKPWVRVGISPFGIWRPGNPPQIQGYDAYAKLYADARKWLVEGWLDYCVPQLYWEIRAPEQSFPVLLNWWTQQNPRGRHLVPGLNTAKTAGGRWQPMEIVDQIKLTRKTAGVSGHAHWNMRSLLRNRALSEALSGAVYSQEALPPATTWLSRMAPPKPQLRLTAGERSVKLNWSSPQTDRVRAWLLQTRRGRVWSLQILPGRETSRLLDGSLPDVVALTPVDRFGNTGRPAVLQARPKKPGG